MWKITTKHLKIQADDWVYFGPGAVTANIGTIQFDFDTTGHPENPKIIVAEYNGIRITFTKWQNIGWWEHGLGFWPSDYTQEIIEPEYVI